MSRPPVIGVLVLLALAGCGGGSSTNEGPPPPFAPGIGRGAEFRPPSLGPRAASGRPIDGLRCTPAGRSRVGAHLELFAAGHVVLVAPGIGVAPPRVRSGAYVRGGRCSYPLRTREPTGVIEIRRGTRATLGQFFDIWGQPLGPSRMAGFRGRVRAYVAGVLRSGDPRAVPLTAHAEIVLEVGPYVRPHPSYRFPPGL